MGGGRAAAGLPHLSRKKGECASLSTVCADCDLRFLNFSSEVFWPPKFAYSRRRFFVYIYEDIYIYIFVFVCDVGDWLLSHVVVKKC